MSGIPSHARVLGITGPPGSGKSTMTSSLVRAYRAQGLRVAVLAVDPSSPYSGGALLGDRIRMLAHTRDDGVFIRSMASHGDLGGLSASSVGAVAALKLAGFDVILVETVGVGQSEIDVVEVSDTTLVLIAPNTGDGVQAVKAGIIEAADIFVVNKADQPGADITVRQLREAVRISPTVADAWRPPVVTCVATQEGGVEAVAKAVDTHREWLTTNTDPRRRNRTANIVRRLAISELQRRIVVSQPLLDQMERGELDYWTGAARVVEETTATS